MELRNLFFVNPKYFVHICTGGISDCLVSMPIPLTLVPVRHVPQQVTYCNTGQLEHGINWYIQRCDNAKNKQNNGRDRIGLVTPTSEPLPHDILAIVIIAC